MQRLIQSRLKEIFIVISAIIFKGKATHRFIRKRGKILQQSSAQSSSLYCRDQSSLEGCSKLTAPGLSPLRSNKTGTQEPWQSQHHGGWRRSRRQGNTGNPRMAPQGVTRGGSWTPRRPETQLRDKSHHFLLSYLWATLNTCLPRGTQQGPRDTNTDTGGHLFTPAVWGLKKTSKTCSKSLPTKSPSIGTTEESETLTESC